MRTYTGSPWVLVAMLASCRADAVRAGPTLELAVDGVVRTVIVDRAIPLASVVAPAPASWLEVRADATRGRWIELPTPASTYAGDELRLYVDHGLPALGVFPPVTSDMPPEVASRARQPIASLDAVSRVEVVTHRPELPALIVELDGRAVSLPTDQLRALHEINRGPEGAHGWLLADLIALATGDRVVGAVRLVAGSSTIDIDLSALHDPARPLVIKPNQRGEYVYRAWAPGHEGPVQELRGVTKIVVE